MNKIKKTKYNSLHEFTCGGSTEILPKEGLISYMWIHSDSDLTSLINFQGVCVTRLMCSPLAGNFWCTPVLVHIGLIHGVMTSLPWQTGLQSWQSCTIALAHSVGYEMSGHYDSKNRLQKVPSPCDSSNDKVISSEVDQLFRADSCDLVG